MIKSKLGREGFALASSLTSQPITVGGRAGTLRQELVQRPWKAAANWLVLHFLLRLLSYTIQELLPRSGGAVPSKLGPLHQANLVGAFSQLKLPLPK